MLHVPHSTSPPRLADLFQVADALKTKQKSELIESIGRRLHSLEQANKLILEVNGRATSATRKQAQQVTKPCGLV